MTSTSTSTSTATALLDSALAPLDAARRDLLALTLRVKVARRLFVDPRRRVVAASLVAVAVAAAFALAAPLASLFLGAALLGAPHVASGLRHVVFRPGPARVTRPTRLLALAGLAVGAAQLAGLLDLDAAARAFALLFAAAILVEVAASDGAASRRALLAVATAVTLPFALARPTLFFFAASHLHALGAVAVVALAGRRRGITPWPLLLATSAVFLAGASGLLDPLLHGHLACPRSAARSILVEALAATGSGAFSTLGRRALFLYAFGQSLHFAVWLRLLPDVERAAPVPQPLRRARATWRADLGSSPPGRRLALPLLAAAALAIPLLLALGGPAREAYFCLTYFHFGLEAAALARLLASPPMSVAVAAAAA